MHEVDITIMTKPQISMAINTNDKVRIIYSYLPKIKYNYAIDTLVKLGFKHIKNLKIGENTHELYER